jgi:Zn-dependent protease
LAVAKLTPFLGAVLIAWIFSVCFHEFAHAVVAYWGGDRSVRERGYLSFNPFLYVHPVTSILLPCLFLLLGGIPLPGGAVSINRSILKSNIWEAAVSAAGPLSNFLLFLLIALVIHPSIGLVDAGGPNAPMWARLLGVLAVLQVFAVFLNLIPVPPLDGFGIIEAFMDDQTRMRLANPQFRWIGLLILFFVFFRMEAFRRGFLLLINGVLVRFGLPWESTWGNFKLLFGGA